MLAIGTPGRLRAGRVIQGGDGRSTPPLCWTFIPLLAIANAGCWQRLADVRSLPIRARGSRIGNALPIKRPAAELPHFGACLP